MKKALKITAWVVGGLILLVALFVFEDLQKFVVAAGIAWLAYAVLTNLVESAVTKVVRREMGNMRAESYQSKEKIENIQYQNQKILELLREALRHRGI